MGGEERGLALVGDIPTGWPKGCAGAGAAPRGGTSGSGSRGGSPPHALGSRCTSDHATLSLQEL